MTKKGHFEETPPSLIRIHFSSRHSNRQTAKKLPSAPITATLLSILQLRHLQLTWHRAEKQPPFMRREGKNGKKEVSCWNKRNTRAAKGICREVWNIHVTCESLKQLPIVLLQQFLPFVCEGQSVSATCHTSSLQIIKICILKKKFQVGVSVNIHPHSCSTQPRQYREWELNSLKVTLI